MATYKKFPCTSLSFTSFIVRLFNPLGRLLCFSPPVDGPAESDVQDRLVYCYPIRLGINSPTQPRVELHFENDVACLRFKGEMVKVSRSYFAKLVRTFFIPAENVAVVLSLLMPLASPDYTVKMLLKTVYKRLKIFASELDQILKQELLFLYQELLYRYSCIDDPRFEKFLSRVWCLIKRYQVT